VTPVYKNAEREFLRLPFEGVSGRVVASVMSFYNRRLVALAKRRMAAGVLGQRNAGWRELYDGFVPDIRVRKMIQKGLFRWWRAELRNLRLMFQPATRLQAPSPVQANAKPAAELIAAAKSEHAASVTS
jgi:hypothetical protein